jgi:hypothetical protein
MEWFNNLVACDHGCQRHGRLNDAPAAVEIAESSTKRRPGGRTQSNLRRTRAAVLKPIASERSIALKNGIFAAASQWI